MARRVTQVEAVLRVGEQYSDASKITATTPRITRSEKDYLITSFLVTLVTPPLISAM
jgi:hypothetical protein